jgi:transposase-like protein
VTEPQETEPQPGPVVKVARDLTEIVRLAEQLPGQILEKPNDRLMPGGVAMVASAADADLGEWSEQIAYLELQHYETCLKVSHKRCHIADHVLDEDDQHDEDPLRTLLWWSEERRERYGYPLDGRRATFQTEADFLRWALDGMWRDEPRWEDFADDVNRTRRKLEDMLKAGQRQHRTRVPCDRPACGKHPMLVKIHGETEFDDRYKCPTCKHWFDEHDFNEALKAHLRSKGAERFVPITEAIRLLAEQGRSKHTVRKWLAAEKDAPTQAWEFPTWRRMVWWPDLWTKHLTTQTRKRDAA